jgi:resuscitation-promoting factor RpfA
MSSDFSRGFLGGADGALQSMVSLPKFFTRNKNRRRLAVTGAIAVACALVVAVAIAIIGPANTAPAPTIAVPGPVAVPDHASATHAPTWDRLAQCESSGDWAANSGNGFSGGLQFTASTWRAYGGQGKAHTASRTEQITVAERVLTDQGWDAWPACSTELGLR